MKYTVALVYYANIDHYSVTSGMRNYLINGGYLDLLSATEVPINICFTGTTLEALRSKNPKFIQEVKSLGNVKFLHTSYSHFIPSELPEDIVIQTKYGKLEIDRSIPLDKQINIMAPPEYDVTSCVLKTDCLSNCFLASSSIINHGDFSNCNVFYRHTTTGKKLLCVHKDLAFRGICHSYLREMCTTEDVLTSIKSDLSQLPISSPLICAIDFETPIFNQVYIDENKEVSPPRLDLFASLHQAYSKSSIRFIHLDEVVSSGKFENNIDSLNNVKITVNRSTHYRVIFNTLEKLRNRLIKTNPKLYMNCMTSDFYTFSKRSIKLPSSYCGRNGFVIIRRSGANTIIRKKNLSRILANV
ncbi:hypothetical protein CO058_02010 [candidate division WWE3 bacterium CG_4_9_14_0_2_um_filter_35_11]|uniref:Uncharacterized protein n=1 Tax=candidate division WWE3 bacterium CG_4_9_14_0_2_um_filter_35_11 TaxID=1975077 RepID=A0A2M8ELU8_UNCKA|nr:MAG: hypothetical protein COV25_03340 [candidate division WWE3 bacterium CG10_big_fil_rev_8_21_14_0_10_35_32]PJC23713.1 MAG: hypothetical protein CO058_02010 [candidate division WWE3 bacterium CG_4_9_14_0_2_um_filter_35_11]